MDWKTQLEALKQNLEPSAGDAPEEAAEKETPTSEDNGPRQNGRLEVLLDRKGRKGKEATIVVGFTVDDAKVEEVAATLKKRLGCGGSARSGEILIQGDKRRQVAEILKSLGFGVR